MQKIKNFQFYFKTLELLLLIFNKVLVNAEANTQKLTWNNLEEFVKGGWLPVDRDFFGPGVAFPKPSDLNSSLLLLDERMTRGGVWSGKEIGNTFAFQLNLDRLEELGNIKEANLTLKYYCGDAGGSGTISFFPCSPKYEDEPLPDYYCFGKPNYGSVEWYTAEFSVEVSQAKVWGFLLIEGLTGLETNACLLDYVKFSYIKELSFDHDHEPRKGR